MDAPSPRTFRKSFSDRYSLSREWQILDYLNQRHAPVPSVVMSHPENGYLEMSHAGDDLRQWLQGPGIQPAWVKEALRQAIDALVEVANLGIWHLDIATRNFVIHHRRPGMEVRLIDFANAVSEDFPLQKPLWMMPSPALHPGLSRALIQDWQALFDRNNLRAPDRWDHPFEIPIAVYQKDWTRGLHVEKSPAPWAWLAHGVAHLVEDSRQRLPSAIAQSLPHTSSLMNQEDDQAARVAVAEVRQALRAAEGGPLARDDVTPRPRVSTTAEHTHQGAAFTSRHAASTLSSAPSGAATQSDLDGSVRVLPSGPSAPGSSRRWIHGVAILAGLIVSAFGWLTLDSLYAIVRAPATWLTLASVTCGAAATFVILLALARKPGMTRAWASLLIVQVLSQGMLITDLWLAKASGSVLLMGAAWPLMTLVLAIFIRR